MQKYLVNNTDELPTKENQCLQNLLAVGPEIVLVAGKQTFNTTPWHSPRLVRNSSFLIFVFKNWSG